MPVQSGVPRFSWTLVDQVVVSVGSFAVNVTLARLLLPPDYGTFAAVVAALLLLQMVNLTTVMYPATLRMAAEAAEREHVIGCALVIAGATTCAMSAVITVGMAAFGDAGSIPEVVGWFVAWQMQEALRRLLFADLRYRAAIIGDAISYLGQAAAVGALALADALTLRAVFVVLALTSLFGAAVQSVQVGIPRRFPRGLAQHVREDWTLGYWSLIGSVVAGLRFQLLLWFVGVGFGRAELGAFQAVLNVANVVNPVSTAVCNVVPQVTARSAARGWAVAWRASRVYALWGLLPTASYSMVAFAAPTMVLRIFYGDASPYVAEASSVRIFALAIVLAYAGEVAVSFTHGLGIPRAGWLVNIVSLVAVLLTFMAFQDRLGWRAAVLAAAFGQAVRLLLCFPVLRRYRVRGMGSRESQLGQGCAVQATPSPHLR